MKEQLYTIPLNDAFHANDECPFCFIERNVEQDLLDFVLGSGASYMESDVRADTDRAGFCRAHFKKMFDYGNTLGNGWILKTHYMQMRKELAQQTKSFTPGKSSLVSKIKKSSAAGNSVSEWVKSGSAPAISATVLPKCMSAIWIPFSICTGMTRILSPCLKRAKDSA